MARITKKSRKGGGEGEDEGEEGEGEGGGEGEDEGEEGEGEGGLSDGEEKKEEKTEEKKEEKEKEPNQKEDFSGWLTYHKKQWKISKQQVLAFFLFLCAFSLPLEIFWRGHYLSF